MKRIAFSLVMLLVLAFAACKKEEPYIPPDPNQSQETSITFTCKDSVGIGGIFIGIAAQQADRDLGIFFNSGTTSFDGKLKFSGLDAQELFYSARRTIVGGVVKRDGSVQIVKNQKKFQTINF